MKIMVALILSSFLLAACTATNPQEQQIILNRTVSNQSSGTSEEPINLDNPGIVDQLEQGETKTYTLDGRDYEIAAKEIDYSANSAIFTANNKDTNSIQEGNFEVLSDGTKLAVLQLIPKTAPSDPDLVQIQLVRSKG